MRGDERRGEERTRRIGGSETSTRANLAPSSLPDSCSPLFSLAALTSGCLPADDDGGAGARGDGAPQQQQKQQQRRHDRAARERASRPRLHRAEA